MNKFKLISILIFIFFTGIFVGIKANFYLGQNEKKKEVKENSIYERIKAEGNIINKSFKNDKLDPLITIAEKQSNFNIKLDGIKKDEKVVLINTYTGEKVEFNTDGEGIFSVDTSLETGKDYGILMNNKLIGSIKIIDSFKNINIEEEYNQSLKSISCGL